jgi:polygalacturonase
MVYWSKVTTGLISNIVVKNCPNHCLELYTDHGEVANVTVTNPSSTGGGTESHNTDAVDIHGQPFYVHDCTFSTGDDNIAAHNNDTLVENCYFGDGHGASIGSVCNEYIQNVTFNKITFNKTTTAIRIKTDQGCGGFVKQVTYSNLEMYNVGTTIDINMYYATSSNPTKLVIDTINIENIQAYSSTSAGEFNCVPDSPCHHIALKNVVHLQNTPKVWTCSNAYGTASNVTPSNCLKP